MTVDQNGVEGNSGAGRPPIPGGEPAGTQAGAPTNSPTNPGGDGDTVKSELEKLKGEIRKIAEDRDRLKGQLKKREDDEKAKAGEFQTLWEKEKAEADALRARVAAIDAANAERLKEAEGRLSKDEKTEYDAFIVKLSVDERLAWADLKIRGRQNAPIPPNSPGANNRPNAAPAAPGKLTVQELAELRKTDPAAYFAYLKNA